MNVTARTFPNVGDTPLALIWLTSSSDKALREHEATGHYLLGVGDKNQISLGSALPTTTIERSA